MKISQRGINDLVLSEGLRISAYKDTKGVWTIGVGHTSMAGPPEVHPGLTVTRAEALAIFARDLAKFEKRVDRALGKVPQNVFDGAVSFDFNTGSIERASWVESYKIGDLTEARRRFMWWNQPKEIIPRRAREAALIFSGHYATGLATTPLLPPAAIPAAVPAGTVSHSPPAGDSSPSLIARFFAWLWPTQETTP